VLASRDRRSLRDDHRAIENGVRCGRALNHPLNDRPVGDEHPREVSRIRAAQRALRGRICVEVHLGHDAAEEVRVVRRTAGLARANERNRSAVFGEKLTGKSPSAATPDTFRLQGCDVLTDAQSMSALVPPSVARIPRPPVTTVSSSDAIAPRVATSAKPFPLTSQASIAVSDAQFFCTVTKALVEAGAGEPPNNRISNGLGPMTIGTPRWPSMSYVIL